MSALAARQYTLTDVGTALKLNKSNVARRAEKESWLYTEMVARGGKRRLYELSSLPHDVQAALQRQAINAALPVIAEECAPITLIAPEILLSDKQKQERAARARVLNAIQRFRVESGCTQENALRTILSLAATKDGDPAITRALRVARDARGRKGPNDNGLPKMRTLKRWLSLNDLTPHARSKDMSIPIWAKDFLQHYQRPQKPSVAEAYGDFLKSTNVAPPPSIHQARRFLNRLGVVDRERGRMLPRELKKLQPFVRRAFEDLEPNDVWSADGHTFDAEVQHPFHGRPFRPEITSIIDIATRRVVGWSVTLAESSIAVLDALRYAAEQCGCPAIFYTDNGSGYSNALLDDDGIGLQGRLGFEVQHSLPYNSQARGVIERLHKTLWVPAAKKLPSYIGAPMDRQAKQMQYKLTRAAIKKGGAMPLIPWDVFMAFCAERVAEYNAAPHRTLKKSSPDLVWRGFEARGWEAARLSADDFLTIFRPRVERVLARAEIRLYNNIYFARALEQYHGMRVLVAYDIHDASRVWVHLPDGRMICEAECDGNRRAYFPRSVVLQAREKRARARLNRLDVHREEILAEWHGTDPIVPAAEHIVLNGRTYTQRELETLVAQTNKQTPEPAPVRRSERPAPENYAEWMELQEKQRRGEVLSEIDAQFILSWPTTGQGKSYLSHAA
jgi:putative transposase